MRGTRNPYVYRIHSGFCVPCALHFFPLADLISVSQELLEARAWYESKALGLGFEFARAADAAVAFALRNPLGHFRIEEEFRRVLFRKFPYMLIYLPSPDELLVVSFFHQRREPSVWIERGKLGW